MLDTVIAALPILLGAIGGFLIAHAQSSKTRAEAKRTRLEVQRLQSSFHHEMRPNSGGSLKDQLNRIEKMQDAMAKDVGRLADSDLEIQRAKETSHEHIHKRIDRVVGDIQSIKKRVWNHE